MTPGPYSLDDDSSDAETSEARRRRYQRRRLTAGAAVLLLVVWVASLLSSGGSGKPHAATRSTATVSSAALLAAQRSLQAQAAERARESQAIQSALSYTAYVTVAGAAEREMALTFDDGPGPFTPQVLTTLRRLHTPATFFLVGRSIKDFGAYVTTELADGFALGDHTQDHPPMATLSRQDQVRQLLDQAKGAAAYGAPFPQLFRPPYGSFNATTLSIAKKLKMLTILWTIDTADFRQPGVDVIVRSVIGGARPGAIVLMHDAGGARAQTIAALPRIVKGLHRRGYTLVTVPRLLADNPPVSSQEVPPAGLSGG
ncbi:MAG: polysaccharide deacetylase family protein [Solirubrobacteraceae bacterium]